MVKHVACARVRMRAQAAMKSAAWPTQTAPLTMERPPATPQQQPPASSSSSPYCRASPSSQSCLLSSAVHVDCAASNWMGCSSSGTARCGAQYRRHYGDVRSRRHYCDAEGWCVQRADGVDAGASTTHVRAAHASSVSSAYHVHRLVATAAHVASVRTARGTEPITTLLPSLSAAVSVPATAGALSAPAAATAAVATAVATRRSAATAGASILRGHINVCADTAATREVAECGEDTDVSGYGASKTIVTLYRHCVHRSHST